MRLRARLEEEEGGEVFETISCHEDEMLAVESIRHKFLLVMLLRLKICNMNDGISFFRIVRDAKR